MKENLNQNVILACAEGCDFSYEMADRHV
jgi:hypothetical protein